MCHKQLVITNYLKIFIYDNLNNFKMFLIILLPITSLNNDLSFILTLFCLVNNYIFTIYHLKVS